MSAQDDITAIKKKLGDIEWRLDNLYKIKDKFGKVIQFVRNDSQLRLWNNRHYLNLILKDRQRGFSTFIAILILDTCLFNSNQECGIIDITLSDAKKKLGKIKFAYEKLYPWLKKTIELTTDSKEMLEFSNGSTVYVGTSHRGGTLQILHISESGKIAARKPDKSREIRTGALNTIAPGCWVFNESTAEGKSGEFFDDCQAARNLLKENKPLTALDYKFHFFGWWQGTENEIDPEGIVITKEFEEYFERIESEIGIKLNARKRAWYVKKAQQQKDDMTREYPSTPDEAFESAIDGAYYKNEMAKIRADGRICNVPYETSVLVDTFWDLGMNDQNFIWCHQRVGLEHRLINCIFGSGEGLAYYAGQLNATGYVFGTHYMPHDVKVRELGSGISRMESAEKLGIKPIEVVPRAKNMDAVLDGINMVRNFLASCWIDKTNCSAGIDALDGYRKDWDDKLGCFKSSPLHNHASNGADALRTGAVGYIDANNIVAGVKPAAVIPGNNSWM